MSSTVSSTVVRAGHTEAEVRLATWAHVATVIWLPDARVPNAIRVSGPIRVPNAIRVPNVI
jgi:hypothetical protein